MASNEVVNTSSAHGALVDGARTSAAGSPEDQELARVNRGRSRLGLVFDEIEEYDAFEESSLTVRFKRVGKRGPLASVDPGVLREALPLAEDRASVASYLRARGLVVLADALER
jgi:hypothetical protein